MKGIVLGLLNKFKCIAGRCTSTCCSGWKIVVDEEAFNRFKNISDETLRNEILSNIYEAEGEKRFINRNDGRCSMLDEDGLCHIQRNTDEHMLCNTCRKFPRLMRVHAGVLWVSMAASCPVVAEYIVNEKIEINLIEDNGNISEADIQDIPFISDELIRYSDLLHKYLYGDKKQLEYIYLYKAFIDIVDDVLSQILNSKEVLYLEGSFEYFEEDKSVAEILRQFGGFDKMISESGGIIFDNYFKYRVFSRYLEMPDEANEDRICQVTGEMVLIYIIALSRYYYKGVTGGEDAVCLVSSDWVEIINWVYRTSAHGKKLAGSVHEIYKKIPNLLKCIKR